MFFAFQLALLSATVSAAALAEEVAPRTFCNPLPLENYPVGLYCRGLLDGSVPKESPEMWVAPDRRVHPFRELSDPTILWHDGKWYLYPSGDFCWRSSDLGGTWEYLPQRLSGAEGGKDRIDYAPTVCRHRGKFLLVGGAGIVFQAERPEGPFTELGKLELPKWGGKSWNWQTGNPPALFDPNFFSDDDGRLYFYWGATPTNGIWGVELDAANPLKLVSTPKRVLDFDPQTQPWEIVPGKPTVFGFLEGAWMLKRNGKYILVYAAAGTENAEYAMGQALGTSPLGPFVKPKNNPFYRKTTGFITGTSHGSVTQGPNGTWWIAYTIRAAHSYWFERRVGMDRIDFEADGSLKVSEATETPQWLPGHGTGATGWKRLVAKVEPSAAASATDLNFATFWEPKTLPATLTVDFGGEQTLRSYRLIWHDGGLDPERGVKKGAFRYRVEGRTPAGDWQTLVDASANTRDLIVDYRETPARRLTAVRLVVLGGPKGIRPGIVDFSPFCN